MLVNDNHILYYKKILEKKKVEDINGCLLYIVAKLLDIAPDYKLVSDNDLFLISNIKLVGVNKEVDKEQIDQYRSLFKGIKLGSMGSKQTVTKNLNRWMSENPEYTFDDILRATKTYIENTEPKYVRLAHYFIYKRELNGEVSTLSAVIDDDIKEINNFHDFTTTL